MFAILMAYQFKQNAPDAIITRFSKYAPMAGFFAVVALFSMAGVPPILGFIAKMWVFNLLVQANWLSVAIYAVLFTLLGAFYYIKVVQALYFQAPDKSYHRSIGSNAARLVLITNGIVVVLLGLFPTTMFHLCQQLVAFIG